MSPSQNIVEAILAECNRIRERVLPEYEKAATGKIAAALMRRSIQLAEQAIASNDAVECIRALKDLRGWQL